LLAAASLIGLAAVALPIYLRAAWWLGLPAGLACVLTAWLAWNRHPARALAAATALYAAILAGEVPRIPALWIAPRVEALLKAGWPGWNPLGKGVVAAGYAEPSLMFAVGTDLGLLANGTQAADALAGKDTSVAIVSDRDQADFDQEARHLGLTTHHLGEVRGFNYSRGRWITLGVYTKP
jgi:hypothetical protein